MDIFNFPTAAGFFVCRIEQLDVRAHGKLERESPLKKTPSARLT